MELVKPTVFLVGVTEPDKENIEAYLRHVDAMPFADLFRAALAQGISGAEALCSMFAKLCYKSLTVDSNDNISRVRDIESNLACCFNTGHGSVFEHASMNFVITDCSRVFTHELVRHRVGTAFSQTSGRYVRSSNLQVVLEDPIADTVPMKRQGVELGHTLLGQMKHWAETIEHHYNNIVAQIDWDAMDFATKKKITSYLRRLLPNGQGNEIAVTLNIRSLRHLIQMRTSRFAEWEIRYVFGQIAEQIAARFPMVLHGSTTEEVDGLPCVEGMKMQPYENLTMFSDEELRTEMERRAQNG